MYAKDEINNRKYSDESTRLEHLNRILTVGLTLFYLIFCIATIYQLSVGLIEGAVPYIVILCSIIFTITGWYLYLKNPSSKQLYNIVFSAHFAIYTIILFTANGSYVQFAITVVLVGSILYYNKKVMLFFTILTAIVNIIKLAITMSMQAGQSGLDMQFTEFFIFIFLLYIIFRASYVGEKFTKDMVQEVVDKQKVQKSILDDVLDISGVIRKNTEASNEIVQRLGESSNIVNSAVEQITASTQVIAESIEHQTVMTQSIQQSINDTVKHSKEVVQFANNSTVTIDSSLQVMENLRLQSTTIVSANEDVVIGGVI